MSITLRPPYGAQGGLIEGRAANYTANADGTYTIGSAGEAAVLMAAGWVLEEQAVVAANWVASSLAVAVGQTANVFGAATVLGPDSGNGGMTFDSLDIVYGGTFGSETVTVSLVATYDDGSVNTTASWTATGTGTTALTNAQLRAIHKDNRTIKKLTAMAKSSLSGGSSIATVVLNGHGLNI